jgi:transglutaminase-like putative cysteine protease
MQIRIGYRIDYLLPQPTPMILNLSVHYSRAGDLVRPDALITEPQVPSVSYRDGFGNWCGRLVAPAGEFRLRSDTVISDPGTPDLVPDSAFQHRVEDLPAEVLVYLLGSRYCETDRLSEFAWQRFGDLPEGWDRVAAVNDFVHQHVRFDHTHARPTKTAYETLQEGTGVCRDYAHLGLSLCRALNIPARYCTGYLSDIGITITNPMDFSGWFEVYLSGQWFTVDPRNHGPRIGRILMARGRDAADVAMITTFGPNELRGFEVWTYEHRDWTGLPF